MDSIKREKIRALMQYGGKNFISAYVYITRLEKNLRQIDFKKNNVVNVDVINKYENNHQWFKTDNSRTVEAENNILNYLEITKDDMLSELNNNSEFYLTQISFDDAVEILYTLYFKDDEAHKDNQKKCATAFKLLMIRNNITFKNIADKLGVSRQLVNLMAFRQYNVSGGRLNELEELLGKEISKYVKKI